MSLERERMRLLEVIGRDTAMVKDLESSLSQTQEQIAAYREKLSSYNSLFTRVENADIKAPKQRLGALYSVLGTKRIIARELDRLACVCVCVEMKINRAKEKNAAVHGAIDTLRLENVTFKGLFSSMTEELHALKRRIGESERCTSSAYAGRDRAFEDTRECVRAHALAKLERAADFKVYSEMLEKVDAQSAAILEQTQAALAGQSSVGAASTTMGSVGSSPDGLTGSSLSSQHELTRLRKRVTGAQGKLALERGHADAAQKKMDVFSKALARVCDGTGVTSAKDLVRIFNQYEDNKFSKARSVQRLVKEIERLEREVSQLQAEVQERDDANSRVKALRQQTKNELLSAAETAEAQVRTLSTSLSAALGEVRALYRVVNFAFHALGVESELHAEEAAHGSPAPNASTGTEGTGKRQVPLLTMSDATPARRAGSPDADGGVRSSPKTLQLAGIAQNAQERQELRAGVSGSTLGVYMGTIENRFAEIIQQYAALVVTERPSPGKGNARASAPPAAELSAQPSVESLTMQSSASTVSAHGSPTAAEPAPAFTDVPPTRAPATPRPQLAHSALGPFAPTGKSREVLATSALIASIAVDSIRMADEQLDNPDDGGRPFNRKELRQQAERKLNTDRGIRVLRNAAGAAAAVLTAAPSTLPSK